MNFTSSSAAVITDTVSWQPAVIAASPVGNVSKRHSLSSRHIICCLSSSHSFHGLSSELHLGTADPRCHAQHLCLLSEKGSGRLLPVPFEAQVPCALLNGHLSELVDTKLQGKKQGDQLFHGVSDVVLPAFSTAAARCSLTAASLLHVCSNIAYHPHRNGMHNA
jgi:hypothetical protein